MNILLVEDDAGIGRFVHRGLSDEGHQVAWIRNGGAVRGRLAGEPFDAMILDLGLPDLDGAELCADLRREGTDLPICMLTARATLEDKLDGFRAGADDYLPKPFAFAELLARLTALHRRPHRQMLTIGALRIDFERREAWLTTKLALRPREYDLLAALAREAGTIVARADLLDAVWGTEEITDNLLDVYIGYLRRRLTDLAGAPAILTARGVGFGLFAS